MKSLNIYSDYMSDSTVGSIKDNISEKPIENKTVLLKYLKNRRAIASIIGVPIDVISGETITDDGWLLFSDGEYEWSNDIVYYFENYNLKLPDDFINHVLKKQK